MTATQRRQAIVRKPKQSRSKATVAAILEAAAQILAKDGWDGFNTNVIAKRAGVSIGSLYEYFPNKQALVDAIAEDHLSKGEALVSAASSLLVPTVAPDDIVKILVSGIVELHKDDPELHRMLSSEVPISPMLRKRVDKLRATVIERLADALKHHISQNRIAAQLLFDVADAAVHRWFIEDDGTLAAPERLAEQLQCMMRAYLDGLRERA
ncbi:TetR/AcrR family transcriptional regulator [Pseudaestuariivita rosea]|uniref:TetR/AcrR family transcriptional regulator n=1 Tax=Pseudaestuariivita rosea TaxID=2763263 RepID=UPI001ABABCC4|nr:TetR/AcrR family transcriptional regulator [Pseudaestuariivita rosea]